MAFNEFLIGKRERMTWIAESTYGAGGTTANGEVVGVNVTVEPDWSLNWQEKLTAGADNNQVQGRVISTKTLPYTMVFNPVSWVWMKYLMACTDGTDGGTKTHTFAVRNTILSYQLEWARRATTSTVLTVVGNVVKNATMSFAKATGQGSGGFITVSLGCVGQDVSEGSSVATIAAQTSNPFQFKNIKWTLNSTEIKEVNNGELSIDLSIDENDSRYCNTTYSALLGEPIPKTFRINGRMNVNIKSNAFYALWAAGTVVGGTNTLLIDRDGTGNDQILFTFSNFYVLGAVGNTNLEGVTNVDCVISADGFTSVVARDSIATY